METKQSKRKETYERNRSKHPELEHETQHQRCVQAAGPRAGLAEKDVSRTAISTLEKALKRGKSFKRVEDFAILDIFQWRRWRARGRSGFRVSDNLRNEYHKKVTK